MHQIKTLKMATLFAAALAVPAGAQDQATLVGQLAAKKKAAFLDHADWALQMADAKVRAKTRGQLIFAYFTRSYAP